STEKERQSAKRLICRFCCKFPVEVEKCGTDFSLFQGSSPTVREGLTAQLCPPLRSGYCHASRGFGLKSAPHSLRRLGLNTNQPHVEVILKLYELRRDPVMRNARDWYFTEFRPKNAKEIFKLMLSSLDQSRYYRMITSYWDMAASFVNNGGIDEKMFNDAN